MNAQRQQAVVGETGHKYFHLTLNMADDDLDPFQYRLLGHYVRWAGYGGIAQETIKETAARTRMSERKVRAVRDQLVEMGYLYVYEPTLQERGDGLPAIVEVLDRWLENVGRYAEKEPDANMHEVVAEADADIPQPPDANMHHKYLEEQKSLEEKESAPKNGAEVLPEKKKRSPPSRSENFKLLALESFEIADVDALDGESAVLLNKLERWLKNNSPGATVETLKAFYTWYDRQHPGAARPRDSAKFGRHFIAFRQQHLVVRKPPEVINAGRKIVAAETNWQREPAEAGK